jgi:hypothetical protein
MDIRQSYVQMCRNFPGGIDALAAAMATPPAGLNNRIYEAKGQRMHVDTAMLMQQLSASTVFAQAVASASGGTFVPLPRVDLVEDESIEAKFNEVYGTVGQLFAEFRADITDGVIDEKERDRLVSKGEDLHRCAEELLALIFSVYCKHSKRVQGVRVIGGTDVAGGRANGTR